MCRFSCIDAKTMGSRQRPLEERGVVRSGETAKGYPLELSALLNRIPMHGGLYLLESVVAAN